jgi:hypothetical protein
MNIQLYLSPRHHPTIKVRQAHGISPWSLMRLASIFQCNLERPWVWCNGAEDRSQMV